MTEGLPLSGVRVLDLSRLIPGALVTRWLADLGADVLKVEDAERGGPLRAIPPYLDGRSLLDDLCSAGKASLAVDLRSDAGVARLCELAGVADVIVDGSRPGASARMGLDLAQLRRERPEVVVCSVTGFGLEGALASTPSHGLTIDLLAGVVDVDRQGGGRAQARGVLASTVGIEVGVLNAVVGIMASLMDVRRGHQGAWLDISLWDAAVEANRINVALALTDSDERLVMGDQGALYAPYECSDGHLIMLGALEEKFWTRFCEAIDRRDLLARWGGTGSLGFGDDDELGDELAKVFAERTSTDWLALAERSDVPITSVLDADDVVRHPHFADRQIAQGTIGDTRVPNISNPIRRADDGVRLGAQRTNAPALGEGGEAMAAAWMLGAT